MATPVGRTVALPRTVTIPVETVIETPVGLTTSERLTGPAHIFISSPVTKTVQRIGPVSSPSSTVIWVPVTLTTAVPVTLSRLPSCTVSGSAVTVTTHSTLPMTSHCQTKSRKPLTGIDELV